MIDKDEFANLITQDKTIEEALLFVKKAFHLILNEKKWVNEFYLHPLGFYYCRLFDSQDNQIRLHLWEENYLIKKDLFIHDHYYDLCSWVLFGEILDYTYSVTPTKEITKYSKFISGYKHGENNRTLKRTNDFLKVEKIGEKTISKGQKYYIPIDTYHSNKILFKNTDITTTLVFTYNHKDNHSPNVVGLSENESYLEDHPKPISSDKVKSLIEKVSKKIFDKTDY